MITERSVSKWLIVLVWFLLATAEAPGQHPLLRELAREDQEARRGKEIARTDEDRVKLVIGIIARGEIKTAEDRFNAGLVLHHTPFTFCEKRMVSTSPDNYLLAHHLFQLALDAGFEEARYLVAASIDRYLSMTEGYQKYGTQRLINQDTGREELVPIDRKTPDSERAKYGVPPVAELLKKYPEQAPKKP